MQWQMKKEYDFSGAIKGKFYKRDLKLNLPVYLDEDNLQFIEKIAKKRNLIYLMLLMIFYAMTKNWRKFLDK